MTAIQLPLAAARRHNNQQLFSDYYLDRVLPERPEWKALALDAAPVMAEIARIYAIYQPSAVEAQTEDDLVKPVLRVLGHSFEIQAPLRTPLGTKKPDYVFYRNSAALAANRGITLDDGRLQGTAFAVGDAKYWERPLDHAVKAGDAADISKHPAVQIDYYIRHSGLAWGILTNGRLWRLYHKDSSAKLDRFYEVDLPVLIESGSVEAFLFFYAFFRRVAFDEGPLGLETLLEASSAHARGVSEGLKLQVYDALRHMAQGFLDYEQNKLTPNPPTLKQIYDASLIVLYRLLFILYAEARELLPLRASDDYRESYSLAALSRSVARNLDSGRRLLTTSDLLWSRLRALFGIIDRGSPPLKVATFNGGLFDGQRHPFLEQAVVGDLHLQQAIDKLARVSGQFVDYRDLAERHLGAIYEGLLEYQLVPLDPHEGEWAVALVNDKGERKMSGSYYTPDFVVRYIVEQTLGPVLAQAVAGKATEAEKAQAVLRVNCLDPSMGSGHFPVAAMEYIARFLVSLALTPEGEAQGETDLAYWKRRVAQNCIYGVDLNPLAVELAKLSMWLATAQKDKPLSFLDHHLRCGNALVGARLADLRLGAGDAKKRAAQRQARQQAAGQRSMLDDPSFAGSMSVAVGSMWLIEETAGDTVAEVKEQERVFAEVREQLTRKYHRLANLVTATHFGLAIDETLWQPLADYASGRVVTTLPKLQGWVDEAAHLAAQRRFFHWELEFPEVFFDRFGQSLGERAGFDVVVGNPPYVRQEELAPFKPYFAEEYANVYHGVADLYVYFYRQGLELLRASGRMSYIVTNKWLRAGYGEPLRSYFAQHAAVRQIVDFGHAPIFEDADTFPSIIVLEKTSGAEGQVHVTLFPREALKVVQLDGYVQRYGYEVPQRRLGAAPWSLEPADVNDLMAKIRQAGVPLNAFAGVKPYFGIKTGLNEAFVIDASTKERLVREDPRSAEVIKPYLRGQDMERWVGDWQQLWLIVLKSSGDYHWPWSHEPDAAEDIFQQTHPAIYSHLKPFEEKLRKRQDKGRFWWELRACAYYDRFEQPKIFYPDITWRSSFALDTEGRFSNNTIYFLPTASPWLLAVLNSPLLWWFAWREAAHGKDEALRFFSDFVERIPIAPASDEALAEVEPAVAQLVATARQNQAARHDTLNWLRTEFAVETPGQRLEAFATLDENAFIEEVRKRRPKAAGKLSPAGLRALREGYAEQAGPLRARQVEAQRLEQRLAALVNAAYELTPEEVELLWRTAPPRMPVGEPK
jgi:hypothetical protein